VKLKAAAKKEGERRSPRVYERRASDFPHLEKCTSARRVLRRLRMIPMNHNRLHRSRKLHHPAIPMAMAPSISSQLLPPIELQPPSPPRDQESDEPRRPMTSERSIISSSGSLAAGVESLLFQPSVDSKSILSSPPTITPRPSPSKSSGSPKAASLGRATQPPPVSVATGIVPRRNSLGDLKIPAKISQAQVESKRDLGMVREFAAKVESEFSNHPLIIAGGLKLLSLQVSKSSKASISPSLRSPRAWPTSLTPSNLSDILQSTSSPFPSVVKHQQNPSLEPAGPQRQFAAAFFHLDHKYKISWECAELLELGGGLSAPAPQSNASLSRLASRAIW